MRDPHEPVIPGQHKHPKEGHGGFSMPIGVSGDLQDRHDHVGPGEPAVDTISRAEHEQRGALNVDDEPMGEMLTPEATEGQQDFAVPEGMMLVPIPQTITEEAKHVQDSFISGLQLAEELKADEPQS